MGAIFNFQIRSGKAKDRNSEPRISSAENFLKKMHHIACTWLLQSRSTRQMAIFDANTTHD